MVEIDQSVPRALVHVAVEPQHGEGLDRCRRQRVLEQPFQEYDLVVEQAVASERPLHLIERNGEIAVGVEVERRVCLQRPGDGGGKPANESAAITRRSTTP